MASAQRTATPYNSAQAVRYGLLIQTAYDMYNGGQGGQTPTPPALSDYTFIAWVQMRDFIIEEGDWTFYGFIAKRTSAANEFVLAIRGTGDDVEWWDDFTSLVLVPLPGFGRVGYGFHRIYQTLRVVKYAPPEAPQTGARAQSVEPSGTFAEQVAAVVRAHATTSARSGKLQAQAPSAAISVEVTGHSLGAALATLYVAENATTGRVKIPLICTFASPRVGDPAFATKFDNLKITSWRIVNEPDIVPKLPIVGFAHVAVEHDYNSAGSVKWSLACCHSLSTYLHLLDPKQPLPTQCIRPPKVTIATTSVRRLPKHAVVTATSSPQGSKEISVAVPSGEGATITIKISIE